MDIDVSLNGREREFIEAEIRAGRASSEGDVLRDALRLLMDRQSDGCRNHEDWLVATRRTIELRYQRALEGGFVDGEAAFERVRQRMEERWRSRP